MSESNYWLRRLDRRSAVRGGALGIAGLAGAALVGCGGSDSNPAASSGASNNAGGSPAASTGGKVPKDQVRVKPGTYQGSPPPSAAEMDPLANGRYGGTLVHTYLDPPHMDFNRTLSCTVNVTMDYTNNKLTRAKFGPKANIAKLDIEPDLAEKWEVNADATEFVFHLRKGAKFQNVAPVNGREFKVSDVLASYNRYKAGGTQQDVFSEVAKFEAPDDYTLKVSLTQPLVDFARNIAAWSFIWPKELVDNLDYLKEHAVGTGPFIQQQWTKKEKSVFVRNPDYFEKGLPFLDKVVTRVIDDANVRRAAFQTDHLLEWAAANDAEAKDMATTVKDAVRYFYDGTQGSNSNVFRFQMKNPVMQDERTRRAISMSIDRKTYNEARGELNGGFSKTSLSWQALFDKQPTLESEGPWYQYNPAEASKMLQAAGFSKDKPLAFEMTGWYLSASYNFTELVVPVMNQTPELKIKYRQVDNPTAVVLLNDRNFEWATAMTFGPPAYSVDQSVYPFYYSKGGLNFGNLNDPTMDALVLAQRKEQNPAAQKEIWKKIWDRELDIVYDVFLPLGPTTGGNHFHNYVLNYRAHGIGTTGCYGNSQVRSVWLDEGAPNMEA